MDVLKIKDDKFLKELNYKELDTLASDIRTFILENVAKKGGHLSSNLGDVELIIALHRMFDFDKDKILFDVGHQTYTHKILSGRASKFDTLRELDGLSPFLDMNESNQDHFESGHCSTSLSTAMGMAKSRDLNGDNYHIVSFIGDASIANGIAFEALNNISVNNSKIIIILNDNEMSINKSIGGFSRLLSKIRVSRPYAVAKKGFKKIFAFAPRFLNFISRCLHRIVLILRNDNIFDKFGISYIGPVNGHNIKQIEKAIKKAKNYQGPIIIHVKTSKGKGYKMAEDDKEGKYHGIGPFDLASGNELTKLQDNVISMSKVASDALAKMMEIDPKMYIVSAAMVYSTYLTDIYKQYKERTIDVGIAEEHAICYANGLAMSGNHPYVSIYSTFLQRGYDYLVHDVCRINSNITFMIDRAGIVGKDGKTHQGILDVSFIYPLENSIICEISEGKYMYPLLKTLSNVNGPKFVRYQKINTTNENCDLEIEYGKFIKEIYDVNNKITLIVPGASCKIVKDIINNENLPINLLNPIFLKPLDEDTLKEVSNTTIILYDNSSVFEGFGTKLLDYCYKNHLDFDYYTLDDKYITHGKYQDVLKRLGLDEITIINKIKEKYGISS